MKISKIKNASASDVALAIRADLYDSRFIAYVSEDLRGNVKLSQIRLKSSKEYCGNHPSACEVGNPKHRKARYLEGADWVEFDDMLNDLLDQMGVSANVASSMCILRKGTFRRTEYSNGPRQGNGNYTWAKDDPASYEDWCGKEGAPRSAFPEGTPGIYEAIGYSVEG